MDKSKFIEKIKAKNQDLREGEIEGVLSLIKKSNSPLSLQQIVTKTGIPSSTTSSLIKSIPYIEDINKITFNSEGKKLLKDIEFKPYNWSLFSIEDKKLKKKLEVLRKKYNLYFDEAKREYDQFFATFKTSVQKAKVLERKGLTNKTSIALIGDDDLVSIILALEYPKISKISVLEIDKNIIEVIQNISSDLNLNIDVKKYDARQNIPKEHAGRYDAVLIDPPYTPTGVELFLDRSISLLKPHRNFAGNYVFLNYGNSFKSPQKTLDIQNIINSYDLIIEDTIYKFNKYVGAESIGNSSSLYILKTTPNTEPRNYKVKNIYTYEVIENENFPYVEHYTFKLLKVPTKMFRKNTLDKAVRDLAKEHSLNIVDSKVTSFKPSGRSKKPVGETFTYILASSNLNVHTWPEYNSMHIDLITCSPIKNSNLLAENIGNYFKTNYIDMRRVE